MVRIAVAGAAGKMGGRIIHVVVNSDQAELAAALEAPGHPAVGRPVAEVCGVPGASGNVGDDPEAAAQNADVLISFTAPEASLQHAQACRKHHKALVVGTTGFDPQQRQELEAAAQDIPLLVAPNMSVAMNLMFKLVGMVARVLGEDYALELVEAHHDQKKDAPSGTAVKLLEELAHARGWKLEEVCTHGRQGLVGARPKHEIGVSVIRGGDIVGDHTVLYIGHGERLEITHRAHSRDTFAHGALRAALWLARRQPGLYDMQDVLALKEL